MQAVAIILVIYPIALLIGSSTSNGGDGLALLSFKAQISDDPFQSLASWDETFLNQVCQWLGVTCNTNDPYSEPRVTALNLSYLSLVGPISPVLANLTSLQILALQNNNLHGPIPHQLGSLFHLQYLNLSYNYLQGDIPPTLANLSSLTTLSLSSNSFLGAFPLFLCNISSLTSLTLHNNNLSGTIPHDIGYSLPRLEHLSLGMNNISGPIPESLGALPNLRAVLLKDNRLEISNWSRLLAALANCTKLQKLILTGNMLHGVLPAAIGNLSAGVEILGLSESQISGVIPVEIGNLINLIELHMSNNTLTGTVPATVGNLPRLRILSLYGNGLAGKIPTSLANNSLLWGINLANNNLTGPIPTNIGNISSLNRLHLSENSLTGNIPPTLATLPGLTSLVLAVNHLIGPLPSLLWNLSSLTHISIGSNRITGSLPLDIGTRLPFLQVLILSDNQFNGHIPASLSNATLLEWIMLNNNLLEGTVPPSLGKLQSLTELLFNINKLEARGASDWSFLDALTNCTNLRRLSLAVNNLGGILPRSITNLSAGLSELSLGNNLISGSIPANIGNLVHISWLDLAGNYLTGSIPTNIGNMQRLQVLYLGTNNLSGELPSTIGNLTLLNRLYLDNSGLTGIIPRSLANCPLELLDLSFNRFSGTIPKEILTISTLSTVLNLASNKLTGLLPTEVHNLKNLRTLVVSDNQLTGTIPAALGECQILEYLYMSGNLFDGAITTTIQYLRGLKVLDLSRNNLTGHVPGFFGEYFPLLENLNLSYNNLEGELPKTGIFRHPNAFSVVGNRHVCSDGGGPETLTSLPPCSNSNSNNRRKRLIVILLVVNAFFLLILLFVLFAAFFYQRQRLSAVIDSETVITVREHRVEKMMNFSPRDYADTTYEVLFTATNGFATANLIGVGSFGTVYKGVMDCKGAARAVAVKVLNLEVRGAPKSFMTECIVLRNTRHRNLVKVFTSCSGCDSGGRDFLALVFDYMPNGSLDMWLHPKRNANPRRLSLIQRLSIAIDVASALNYLHHEAPTPIVHYDLKPSNVLLDHDMKAYAGDFGLARLLSGESTNVSSSTTRLRGTIGYVPPEYGWANKSSTQGDVYSYGVLLLEMFTGKTPTDNFFEEEMSLGKYVETAYPDRVLDITDPQLFLEREGDDDDNTNLCYEKDEGTTKESRNIETATRLHKCLGSVFKVGIFCTKESPSERMQMGDVIRELMETEFVFLRPLNLNRSTD